VNLELLILKLFLIFNKIFSGRQPYQSRVSSGRWRQSQSLKFCNISILWCNCRTDKILL